MTLIHDIFKCSQMWRVKTAGLSLSGAFAVVTLSAATSFAGDTSNNWRQAPLAAQQTQGGAPVYIDSIPTRAKPVAAPRPLSGDQYAPADLEQRLSSGARPPVASALKTPARAPIAPTIARSAYGAPVTPPIVRSSPYPATGGYPVARGYGAAPYGGGASPYGYPGGYGGGLPYGGLPGVFPYNTTGFGPFGGGQPQGEFPFFGFSPFGFW